MKKLTILFLALVVVGLFLYLTRIPYEELDCEVRWELETWYVEHHPGKELKNATFSIKDLDTLTKAEACPQ